MVRKPRLVSPKEAEKLGIDEGSKSVKKSAREQPIAIDLTAEQMEAIRSQWEKMDNRKPAEITFSVEGEENAKLRVAAYAYYSDTCCA
jgi:hypothetical protein